VNWLGDAVMSTPALLRLREAFPRGHIALVTPEKLAELWRHHAAVDTVFAFTPQEPPWSIGRQLAAAGFDVGLAFPNSLRSALELWWARLPMRVGYGGGGRGLLLTHRVRRRPEWRSMRKLKPEEIRALTRASGVEARRDAAFPARAHHLHDYLDLVAAVGADSTPLAPRLFVAPAEIEQARRRFHLEPVGPPLVGLNPGAAYGPAKRWPPDRFIETAVAVHARTPCRWLILGGPDDRGLSRWLAIKLAQSLRPRDASAPATHSRELVIHVAGKTSLRELMACLILCRALLTNDTGPMHVAAAVGTPVVAPFGSTSPLLTAPGLPGASPHRLLPGRAPCAPCFRRECPLDFRCLKSVTPDQAAAALLELLPATEP
jgi:heptosyltransferase-2